MWRTSRQRIDRDMVIDAALQISRRTADREPQQITGATIGAVLEVDRSAVWRHFSDKDDLIVAVGDRALERLVTNESGIDPWGELEKMARGIVSIYRDHPTLAQEIIRIPALGPNWHHLFEQMLASVMSAGLDELTAARYLRVFFEVVTSYATSLAAYELRPAKELEAAEAAFRVEVDDLDPERFPLLTKVGSTIAGIDADVTSELIIDSLRTLLDSYLASVGAKPVTAP